MPECRLNTAIMSSVMRRKKINFDAVSGFFLARSYWAGARLKEIIRKSIETSLCYGVYTDGKQVGFARVVTDYATMYWLCDVFMETGHRGVGVGKKLIETIVNAEELRGLTGILGTRDAHGLYQQYGFIKDGDRFMSGPRRWVRSKSGINEAPGRFRKRRRCKR